MSHHHISQCILVFRGFARSPSVCHVANTTDDRGRRIVLAGELDDNPGTTLTNAIEQAAESIQRSLLHGEEGFELYQYVPKGLPRLEPTFYRVFWRGQSGFSMPEWQTVDTDKEAALSNLRDVPTEDDYTSQALVKERKLQIVDARASEDLPVAI
jgi:hypothetical protein